MKRCAYCRARATYRIQRGDKKMFACDELEHRERLVEGSMACSKKVTTGKEGSHA